MGKTRLVTIKKIYVEKTNREDAHKDIEELENALVELMMYFYKNK